MGGCSCGTREPLSLETEGGRGRGEPQDCVYLLCQLAIKAGGSAEAGESAAGVESAAHSGKIQNAHISVPTCGRRGVPGARNCLILSSLWAYWRLFLRGFCLH